MLIYDDDKPFLVEVSGESCWPELIPGKKYLAIQNHRPKVDDFVVFKATSDKKEYLVKKIAEIKGDFLSLASTVSWGPAYTIEVKDVVGKLVKKV